MTPSEPQPLPDVSPDAAQLFQVWAAQSRELLALTDGNGRLRWCNAAFSAATGLTTPADLTSLAPVDWQAGLPRAALADALRTATIAPHAVALRGAAGAPLWVEAQVVGIGSDRLWALHDKTALRELAAWVQRLSERLEMAQDFGRLGVWERQLPSGEGLWDRHVFGFWGMTPSDGTPDEPTASARIHPDDRSTLYADSTRRAGRYSQRYRVIRPDGSTRWIHSQWEVKNSALGVPDRVVGIMVDDTEVYELAKSRDDAAAQLQLATELADLVIWRHDLKTDLIRYNDHGFKVLGLPHRADGLPIEEARRPTHPDDVPKLAASAAHALATGVPIDVEVRHRRDDGAWRHILVRRVIERGTGGKPVAFVGVSLDVTDRHEALAALHAASERSALIARNAGIGTWETNTGLPAIWDEQMWRLRGLEPRPMPPSREERLALVHPDDQPRLLDARPDIEAIQEPTAYEFRIRLPDGSYRWLASRSTVLHETPGRARRVGVNWDITDVKSAAMAQQQALLSDRANQAKSQFLSRMSHELRTPLNAVLGFTQLLQQESQHLPGHAPTAWLDHIRAAGEHLLRLIDDALDLSGLQAGMLKLDLQPVELAPAVAEALPLVAGMAAEQGVTLRAEAIAGTVRADPVRLRQVLLNLLTNAIKYNRAGGRVTIDSSVGASVVRLHLHDTGRGMDAEQLAHLFEPFNRLGVEGGIEGSGIGLTIVKALIEGMEGSIDVSSAPDTGTSFVITLPTSRPAPRVGSAPPAAAPIEAAAPIRSGQLLYIEDNSVNVMLVEQLVQSLSGLRIVSEATGAAGVARALALRPDLILIDLQLPDFDGFEVLRRLRARPETSAIRCIALSANALPDDIERGLASGFDDYWTKPIKFKPFLAALDRLFPPRAELQTGVVG